MREDRVTIAKAIAIMLMVCCHAGLPSIPNQFVVMFHMPLFFFVSGYCFKEKYLSDSKTYVIKRIKGLYLPFVKWSLLFLVLHNAFFFLNIYNEDYGYRGDVSHVYTITEIFRKGIKIVLAMTETEQLLGGYWFLKELFVGSLLAIASYKFLRNSLYGGGILLIMSIFLSLFKIEVPFLHIGSLSFFSAFFIVMGRAYKKSSVNLIGVKCSVLYFVIVAIGSVYCSTSMLRISPLQIVPYSICALSGTLLVLYISEWLSGTNKRLKSALMFIGNHTLEILTWHFLCFKGISLIIILIHELSLGQLACFPTIKEFDRYYWPMYTVFGIAVPLIFVFIRLKISSSKLPTQ